MNFKNAFQIFLIGTVLISGVFGLALAEKAFSSNHRVEAAVEEVLLRTDIPRCRLDPEVATYLKEAEAILDEAVQDANGYHLRKVEGQEEKIAQNFHQRWATWKNVAPPECVEDIHQRMLLYFRYYELAYKFRQGSWVDVMLDPVYKGYIGLGADNLEITIRLINALKAPPPPKPGPGNHLNA